LIGLSRASSTVLLLASACFAANAKDHLVQVQRLTFHFSLTPLVLVLGSGICVDRPCSVVVTPYHTQKLVGRANLGIIGGRTKKVLSLANESDTNKTEIQLAKKIAGKVALTFNIANDVSFVYAKKPIRRKSGVGYSYKCFVGQHVVFAGYRNHKFETKDAHIIGVNVPLVIGGARLDENILVDISVESGSSGGAVLDDQGNLLGMITIQGAVKLKTGDVKSSIALPVRTIAKALVRLDPALGATIFKDIPDKEANLFPMEWVEFQDNDLPADVSPVIPQLSAFSVDVENPVDKLRTKAALASRRMVDFIAKQCVVQGTQKPLCHELSVVDGEQVFHKVEKDGTLGEPTDSFPVLKHGVWSQSDWNDALDKIAANSWIFQGSVDDHYLFTFGSRAEDERCYFEEYPQGVPLFSGWHPVWRGFVACFEQVLTDKDFNVVAVFTESIPPDHCLVELFQMAQYYDWVQLEDSKSLILLPVRERISAKVQGQEQFLYANVSWTEYKQFRVEHKIRLPRVNRIP
jgi:hypothetical protein